MFFPEEAQCLFIALASRIESKVSMISNWATALCNASGGVKEGRFYPSLGQGLSMHFHMRSPQYCGNYRNDLVKTLDCRP